MSIRIGTRGSALALKQANIVKDKLSALTDTPFEICPISTEGDRDKQSSLASIGGKGVFIKELEQALLDQRVDIAVHSLKDVTSDLADDLELVAFLTPESINDCLILHPDRSGLTFDTLEKGATIGTSSLRRKALIRSFRPDIQTVDIRGNVETRIEKMKSQNLDGIMLSEVGLIRLGMADLVSEQLAENRFVPAPGQGVVAIEIRKGSDDLKQLCRQISDPVQTDICQIERQLMAHLGFDCNYPLGVHTTFDHATVIMDVFMARKNLSRFKRIKRAMHRSTLTHDLNTLHREIDRFMHHD